MFQKNACLCTAKCKSIVPGVKKNATSQQVPIRIAIEIISTKIYEEVAVLGRLGQRRKAELYLVEGGDGVLERRVHKSSRL